MAMKWTQRFLDLAAVVAAWSKDPSTKVGAVAVHPASRAVLETGYNGLPRGVEDQPCRMERPAKYLWTAHAEENLVAHAARKTLEGATVYVTHLCCANCTRMLINAGVKRIVCGPGLTNMDYEHFTVARKMMAEAGVELELQDVEQ
jgi:dCMP deaminase